MKPKGLAATVAQVFLLIFLVVPFVFAQFPLEPENYIAFTPETQFAIPKYGGSVRFAVGGGYINATLDDGTWNFIRFYLTGANVVLPMVSGKDFSIGAQNCNVTVTRFDPLMVFPPQWSGTLEYSVSGVGNQTLNVHYVDDRWLSYTVVIDGVTKPMGDGWTLSAGGWLSVIGAKTGVKISYGMHPKTTFTSENLFALPELNGSVSFAGGGSYIFADNNGSLWKFQNLELGENSASSTGAWGLGFSAEDSNVTITSWVAGLDGGGWVNYTVAGVGSQTLNANYGGSGGWPINYTVYVDGEMKTQNTSWTVTDEGWLTVKIATANVSITGVENIPDWFKNLPPRKGPTGSFFLSDYTVYIAAFIAVVASVVVLTFRRRGKQNLIRNQTA